MGNLKSRRIRKFWKAPINRKLDVFDYRYQTLNPYLSGDTFRAIAEVIVDKSCHNPLIPKKDTPLIAYAIQTRPGDFVNMFFDNILPQIKQPFVLITHNGMTPDWSKYEHHLEDERMLAWYGKNLIYDHPKSHTIPLGVTNRRDPHERGGNQDFWNELRAESVEKDILCYVNVGIGHKKQARYENRLKTVNYFKAQSFATCVGERSWLQYAREMHRSKFVIAPPGEALDTFRLWEALYLGAIPIVTSTPLDPMYRELPVWIVEDWEEVTESALEQKWVELSPQLDNCPQLWASHWYKKILSHV
ncbi:MAG: hypothetical protein JXR10_08050 [Cyclobacteriaceae bacterium]